MQERVRAEWREQYDPNNELSLDELRQKVRDEFTSQARSQLAKEIGEEEVNVMDVQNVMEQMQQRNREMFKVRQLTSRSADTSRARPIPATPSLLLACITCSPSGRSPPRSAVIFVLGCVPFVYAGIEFWTRIANGDSFGTGKDSVVIKPLGEQYDGNKRVLGQDAMIAARILFGIAGASAVLVVVSVFDVLSSTGSP